jgi:hypothetical protein
MTEIINDTTNNATCRIRSMSDIDNESAQAFMAIIF